MFVESGLLRTLAIPSSESHSFLKSVFQDTVMYKRPWAHRHTAKVSQSETNGDSKGYSLWNQYSHSSLHFPCLFCIHSSSLSKLFRVVMASAGKRAKWAARKDGDGYSRQKGLLKISPHQKSIFNTQSRGVHMLWTWNPVTDSFPIFIWTRHWGGGSWERVENGKPHGPRERVGEGRGGGGPLITHSLSRSGPGYRSW